MKQLIIATIAVLVLSACGKREDVASPTPPTYESEFRECIDRNTKPNRVSVIAYDKPEQIRDHCDYWAKHVMKEEDARAEARRLYLK